MKDFHLASRMLTLRGEFYPTGFVFVMLPSEADAAALERFDGAHAAALEKLVKIVLFDATKGAPPCPLHGQCRPGDSRRPVHA